MGEFAASSRPPPRAGLASLRGAPRLRSMPSSFAGCSMRDLGLSVVICTRDRPEDLARCLAAVSALDEHVEVIVVDSASASPCADLVAAYGPRFRYLREDEPGLS